MIVTSCVSPAAWTSNVIGSLTGTASSADEASAAEWTGVPSIDVTTSPAKSSPSAGHPGYTNSSSAPSPWSFG